MGGNGDDAFASQIARDVRAALAASAAAGRPAVGDPRLQIKAAAIALWFLASYAALLSANDALAAVGFAALQGAAAACVGLGIFHDAGHGTLSRRARANRLVERLCCVALGPSRFFWRVKHLQLHHRAPNVHGWDDDVDARGWLRLTPLEPWRWRYAGQHLRAPFLYAFNTVEWFFVKDFLCLAGGRLNGWQPVRPTRGDIAEFWIGKVLWAALFVIPPFVLLPLPTAIAAFAAYHCVFSLGLTVVFQLAHLTSDMVFAAPLPTGENAAHQMRTTANFATSSRLVTFLTGGLNHQIEHHLFPGVAHTHYPRLAPIVAAAARRHGLPYHDLGSLTHAVRGHFAFLRAMGARPHS